MYQFNALKESIELHYYHFGNDNIYDIQMGQNAGCRTCGVTRGIIKNINYYTKEQIM